MRYREIRPSVAAASLVERYWTLELDGDSSAVQRVVPDGRPELILNLGDPFEAFQDGEWRLQPRAFLAGQITGPLLLRPSGPAKIIGVHFHPDGASRVFGQPMHELADQFLPVDFGEADDIRALDAALLHRATPGDPLAAEAVRRMKKGSADIADLASDLGISCRQFERRFQNAVGLSPKLFSRIQRFQQVFQVIGDEGPNWVGAAVECGYYDQAHLIRDFKDFSGETPAVLLAGDQLARHFLSHFSNTAAAAIG
jgi:AraC-like DNA-binding protein